MELCQVEQVVIVGAVSVCYRDGMCTCIGVALYGVCVDVLKSSGVL